MPNEKPKKYWLDEENGEWVLGTRLTGETRRLGFKFHIEQARHEVFDVLFQLESEEGITLDEISFGKKVPHTEFLNDWADAGFPDTFRGQQTIPEVAMALREANRKKKLNRE